MTLKTLIQYSRAPLDFLANYIYEDVIEPINKFGSTENVDSATSTDIWGGADTGVSTPRWVPPTAARVHAIVSTSTDDDTGGTGAITVKIFGLDTNWNRVTETVTLNGTTPVNTARSYIRINRMLVVTSGTGDTNAGTITATAATDSTITAVIIAGRGQTLQAIYSVPNAFHFIINDYYYSMRKGTGAGVNADVLLYVKENADTSTSSWNVKHIVGAYLDSSSHAKEDFKPGFKIPGKSDIRLTVEGCSANDVAFSGGFDGYLVKED